MKKYALDYSKMKELFPIIELISDKTLTEKIVQIWADLFEQSTWEDLENINFCPGINNFTLVSHINVATEATCELAKTVQKYQGIEFNRDIIITLGLLHDVCKLIEYESDGNGGSKKTEIGRKLQHGAIGAIAAYNAGLGIDMVHLIFTHTPLSKLKPEIKEGILFCYADLADADMLFKENNQPIFLGASH